MKNIYLILVGFGILFFMNSCGDDDVEVEIVTKNYLPIAETNEWVYDYEFETSQNSTTDRDTAIILENEVIDGVTYREWSPVFFLFGFSNSVFIRKDEGSTYFKIPELELGFNESIPLPEFRMIEDGSSAGTTLDDFSSEIEFTPIAIPDTLGLTGTITPKLFIAASSTHVNSYAQTTLNGDNYNDVYENTVAFTIQIDLIANLFASGLPINITHTWVPMQDYGDLNTWYANDIGLVRSQMAMRINEVDNTVDIPIIGEIDLEDFGISIEEYIAFSELDTVAELVSYELVE